MLPQRGESRKRKRAVRFIGEPGVKCFSEGSQTNLSCIQRLATGYIGITEPMTLGNLADEPDAVAATDGGVRLQFSGAILDQSRELVTDGLPGQFKRNGAVFG
jgi:hypothetical protein